MDLADAAGDAGLHPTRVRSLVNRYGVALKATYEKSYYQASGSGAFGRYSNHRAAYYRAAINFTR